MPVLRTCPWGQALISNGGGRDPQWNPNGRELFYLAGQQLMSVAIAIGDGVIDPGVPVPLFRVSVDRVTRRNRYVVADGGRRFLFVERVEDDAPPRWTATVNWTLSAEP